MPSSHIRPSPLASYILTPLEPGLLYDPVLRMGIPWTDVQSVRAEPVVHSKLVEAVAAIVAIAAVRAQQSGDLALLREAVICALGSAEPERPQSPDPREAGLPEPPPIRDTQPGHEVERLGALMRRQNPASA